MPYWLGRFVSRECLEVDIASSSELSQMGSNLLNVRAILKRSSLRRDLMWYLAPQRGPVNQPEWCVDPSLDHYVLISIGHLLEVYNQPKALSKRYFV